MKRHQKLMGVVALGGALALAISGCASGSNNGGGNGGDGGDKPVETQFADYNPQPRENLQEGGEVKFPINEIPPQMNAMNGDASADTQRLASWYTPQVFLMSAEGEVTPNPAYVSNYEIGVDGGNTTVKFTVNEKAVWNDGSPIDYTAFDATWKANRSSEEGFVPNSTDGYKAIKSVTQGATPKDVVVTFDGEFAWPQMPFLTGILNPNVNTPDIFNTAYIENPHPEWGAGPYKIDTFDPNGQVVTFVPNEKWWGDKPLLDKVTFTGMDAQASLNAFKNGEIDQVGANNKDRLEQVKDVEDTVIYRAQQTAKTVLIVDADKPVFSDAKVRQAFFMGIDIDQQKKIAWNGLGYEEAPAESLNLYSFQEGYKPSFKEAGLKFDVDAAKKLLDEAGWTEGKDGIREKDGEKLTAVYPIHSDDPTIEALAKAIQQQEKAIGIDLQIEKRAPADFSDDFTSKNWDAFSLRFTDSDPFGPLWFCQMYCSDSTLNLSATGTPEIDAEIKDKVESQTTAEAWTKASMELEPKIIEQTWGVIPLYNGPSISVVKKGLANLTPEPYVGLDGYGVTAVENVGWEK